MIIKFAVTDKDIDQGIRQDGQYCPIALAIRRCFGTESGVAVEDTIQVTTYHYKLDDGNFWYDEVRNTYRFDYPWDSNIREFIEAFDRGYEVKPFEATIEMEEI